VARDYLHGTEVAVRRAEILLESDAQLRATTADDRVLQALGDEARASIEILAEAFRVYGDRPCLGERAREYVETEEGPTKRRLLPSFRVTSFHAVWERIRALATGSTEAGSVTHGDFVGICGFASIDFVVADLACLYAGAISVPLQTAVTATDLAHIVTETKMSCLFCSSDHLSAIEPALSEGSTIRTLVVMDLDPGDEEGEARLRKLARAGLTVHRIGALEDLGGKRPRIGPVGVGADADPDRLVSILYTSGTTGSPKGAMYLDAIWARRMRYTLREPPVPIVTIGCMPLNHVMGRFTIYRTMMRGGLTCFVGKSDMSTLLEDIRLARPTVLTMVPRATAMMLQHFQSRLVELRQTTQGATTDADLEAQIRAEMRPTFLGDRLCLILTGSAATPPETVVFLEQTFGISVVQFYGFNEFGSVSANEHVDADVEYKLEDVPELGYSVADRPYPRGELLVRSKYAAPGYYKLPDVSAHLRDAEGYMRSGDVMEERAPGHLVWIDRKNNVVKLAQGEFVSLTRLEDLFAAGSPYVLQAHLYASSRRAYLLAVIVPDLDATKQVGATDDGAIKRLLGAELTRIARTAQLASHEVPRDVIVEMLPFSKENGLLTESAKPKRSALKTAYGARLEALYEEIEARQIKAVDPAADASAGDRARAAIASALGVAELDASRSFVDLGGDSFTAVRLAGLLERALGFAPAVGTLLDPHTSLAALVAQIEERGDRALDPAHQIEISADGRVSAEALRLDRFLPETLLSRSAAPASPSPRSVLLTGASGFLGRFLLLELLERASARGGSVACVVRGADDTLARERIERAFATGDAAMYARFQRAARAGQLRVLAGDLMRPQLGLEASSYAALARDIECIVHNGALVNHALTYVQLFEPNVLGTVEAIRLALTDRPKSLAFVSSSGVAAGLRRVGAISEEEDAATLWPSRTIGASEAGEPGGMDYAGGYASSKWASEVLLGELARRTGAPAQVFRCSMILPHRTYLGPVNDGDNIVRLLRGLLATGVAPRSFYGADVARPHFDGIPVDIVAAAIAAIALEAERGHHIYHVSNARWDDGVSIDTFADSIHASGHTLERLSDYGAWFAEFRARLERLDERERRRSPLPIIARWAQPASAGSAIHLANARFRGKLKSLLGMDDVPILDEPYIRHCLRSLTESGA
jgi:fatty acid CoA ligase FadD9